MNTYEVIYTVVTTVTVKADSGTEAVAQANELMAKSKVELNDGTTTPAYHQLYDVREQKA